MNRETSDVLEGRSSAPLVSVVVPTFNRSSLLKSCLRSLERQTLTKTSYEVIVVDDGSVDDTATAIASFQRSTAMRLAGMKGLHRGPAAARNLGISAAGAELVAFIDDDCEAAPDWLEAICAPFRDPSVSGVEGKVSRHPDSTPFTHFVENLNGGQFLTANAAYRRRALMAVGGFNESYSHAAAEDWDLAFRIMEGGGLIRFRPEATVVHAPVPVGGRAFVDRVRDRRSSVVLYKRFPRFWQATTGRSMSRSFAEGIFMGPFVEARKWSEYFAAHRSELPRFLWWQTLASARLLVEYLRLRQNGLA